MRIGICENEAVIREQLQELIAAYPTEELLATAVFASGEAMLSDDEGFDLAFLDIELGEGLNGLQVAQELQARPRKVLIIFISSHASYISDALHLDTFQYLLKPLDEGRFAQEFGRCLQHYRGEQHYLTINQFGEKTRLPIASILYIQVEGRKLKVYVKGREEPYETYGRLKEVSQELLPRHFVPCSKSCLINLRFVHGSVGEEVTLAYLDTKKQWKKIMLPVSRRKRKEVEAWVQRYILEQGGKA